MIDIKTEVEIAKIRAGGERLAAIMEKIKEAVKPGVKCSEIDKIAKQFILDSGYGKYMHKGATGHQLGYGVHGDPLIAGGVDETLKPNMVVCLEPRVNVYDQWEIGGVHNEDALLVTESGAEKLVDLKYCEKLLEA